MTQLGSDRNIRAYARFDSLFEESFDGQQSKAVLNFVMAHKAAGLFPGGELNPPEALQFVLRAAKIRTESASLTDNEILSKYCKVGAGLFLLEYQSLSYLEEWDLAPFGVTEEMICELIDFYDYSRDGSIMRVSRIVGYLMCRSSFEGKHCGELPFPQN